MSKVAIIFVEEMQFPWKYGHTFHPSVGIFTNTAISEFLCLLVIWNHTAFLLIPLLFYPMHMYKYILTQNTSLWHRQFIMADMASKTMIFQLSEILGCCWSSSVNQQFMVHWQQRPPIITQHVFKFCKEA